jgi:heme/copper-type cytochrome/quinol oxidase subunit 2
MSSIVFDRRHLKEYLLFGSAAATLYTVAVVLFLYHNSYQHLYYLFMGCLFFMVAIFFYEYKLLYTRYDQKRAVSMLLAGHLTTLTGILVAVVFAVIAMLFFNPHLFSTVPEQQLLPGAAAQDLTTKPVYLLGMILATATIGNFATGSFISIIVSYAGKRDQTKDLPPDMGKNQVKPSKF